MYAIYTYNAGITEDEVLNDLVKIIGGETDPYAAGFSDKMEKEATFIYTDSTTSGWETDVWNAGNDGVLDAGPVIPQVLHSSVQRIDPVLLNWHLEGVPTPITTSAFHQVVRAPLVDTVNPLTIGAKHKYATIWVSPQGIAIAASEMEFEGFPDADDPRDAASSINRSSGYAILYPWEGSGTAGSIHISASPRHLLLNTGVGQRRFGPFGVVEHTRRSPWDTTAQGFTQFGRFAFSGETYTNPQREQLRPVISWCRTLDGYKNVQVLGEVGYMQTIYTGSNRADWTNQISTVDANRVPAHALLQYGVSNYQLSNEGGEISALTDSYVISNQQGGSFDEIYLGTDTYMIWQHDLTHQRMAVRKG